MRDTNLKELQTLIDQRRAEPFLDLETCEAETRAMRALKWQKRISSASDKPKAVK